MKKVRSGNGEMSNTDLPWARRFVATCLLVALVALLVRRPNVNLPNEVSLTNALHFSASASSSTRRPSRITHHYGTAEPVETAEETVTRKLKQFCKSRRELAHALAKRFNVDVPSDVERFFNAAESGRWEEIDAAHEALLLPGEGLNTPRSAELHQIWRAIQETWGIAREAHNWPAQTLLGYGEAVLGSLRPGMVYVGGTDAGCFIPTFLNETAEGVPEGSRHIMLTQNTLADTTYLEYLNSLYGGQMNALTKEDSQRAIQDYLADAQQRLQHDQQFPNESKQIRPGEDVRIADSRVEVSGQVAVMAINEKLLQTLMDKNPDTSFALEESFPFRSTYSNAAPLGPIMELRVDDPQRALTADQAAQSVDYCRNIAQQFTAERQAPDNSNPRIAYSKMICAQASLMVDHNFPAEAEQAFRIANELCPSSPESVFRFVQLLVEQKRFADAILVAENAIKADPNEKQFRDLLNQLKSMK